LGLLILLFLVTQTDSGVSGLTVGSMAGNVSCRHSAGWLPLACFSSWMTMSRL